MFGLVSPTASTTDRRHSHFNRLSTLSNNHSATSQQQNSDDEDMDDNESASTQSTQPISLTSFIHTTTNDHHTGVNLSLRQTRQRMNTNENNSAWQSRTRYSTRSTASHINYNEDLDDHVQPQSSSIRHLSTSDDDDNDMASNSKRNRIERSDRRIASVNRPNYKIDSDEHEDDDETPPTANTTTDIQQEIEQTEKDNDKFKGKNSRLEIYRYEE